MQHKHILVLGCCGSGKSTFARRLGTLTDLPVVHLDALFWKPGWVQASREEFYPALMDALSKDAWIMDGNYSTTLAWRVYFCDLVFWFELPRLLCLWGVLSRFVRFRHKVRPDMGQACPEKVDWEFLKYTWDFKKLHSPPSLRMIRASGKPVVIFRSRRDARRYLKGVKYDTEYRENNASPADLGGL